MPVEDSESRRFELNVRLGFSQADFAQHLTGNCFLRFFFLSLELFFAKTCAQSER